MKPVYVFRNTSTNNILSFSNARLAHETYKELCKLDDIPFIAYSTFRVFWKNNRILKILNYEIERPYLITNQENDLVGNLKHLTTSDKLYSPKYIRQNLHEIE